MKKKVAVVMGGYSGEAEVSRRSGQTVLDNLDPRQFEGYGIHIEREAWYYQDEAQRFLVDRNDFSLSLPAGRLHFDVVFNALHGSPGEDGQLAGYLEMLGIPQTGSALFESALTFNKVECSRLCAQWGANVPLCQVWLTHTPAPLREIEQEIGFPCFVKPSRSGSSIGVSKVQRSEELEPALLKAADIDSKVLIEEMISGQEVGCGVSNHTGAARALAITDIVPQNDFFDYESKYSGASEEITPARIDKHSYAQIMEESEFLYQSLGLNGLVRMDYIVNEEGVPFFIEINTVPGLSPASIVPKQLEHLNWSKTEVFGALLHRALAKKSL